MPRVKRGKTARQRRKAVTKHAKGFRWGRKNKFKAAKEALMHAWSYSYRDRRTKKRDKRALWQTQISAACRKQGVSYNQFINQLKKHNIDLDRKILSQLANKKPEIFKQIIEKSKQETVDSGASRTTKQKTKGAQKASPAKTADKK